MASRSETTAPPELRRLHEVQNRLTKARSDLRSSHASLRAEQSALARAKDQLSAKDEQLIQLQEKLQSRDDEAKIAAEQLIALRQDIDSHNSRSEVAALRIVELERDLQQERQRTAAAVARADKAQQELDESASGSDSVGADEVSQPLDEAQQVLDETAISVLSEPEASPGDHFQTAGRAAQSQAVETLQVAQEAQAKQRCAQEVSAIRSELVALRGLVCALRSEWMKLLPRAKRRLVKEIKLLNNPTAVSPPHARELQTHRFYSVEFRTTMLGLRKAVQNGGRTLFGKRIMDGRTLFLAIDRTLQGFVTRAGLGEALQRLGLVTCALRAEALMEEVPLLSERATSNLSPGSGPADHVRAVDWPEFLRVSRVDGERSPPSQRGRFVSPQHAADGGRRARQQQLALEDQMNSASVEWQQRSSGVNGNLERGSASNDVQQLGSDKLFLATADIIPDLCVPLTEARQAAFKRCDRNGNGWLNLHEIDIAASELWPQLYTSSSGHPHRLRKCAVAHAYHAADENDDGHIGRREFKLFCDYVVYFYQRWDSVFARLGTVPSNGASDSPMLDIAQFRHGCKQLGLQHMANDGQFQRLVRVSSDVAIREAGASPGALVIFLDVFATWCARQQRAQLSSSPTTAGATDGDTGCNEWGRTGSHESARVAWAQAAPSGTNALPSPMRDGERRSR